MEGKSGRVQIGEASIAYEIAGDGEPIVLLHGFALDSRLWDGQVRALSSQYQVIRYDLRGFGQSSPGSEPYSHADDLMALLRHLGIGAATVVGLSLGGGVAINFALAYPEAVRAIVAVDATLGGFRFSPEFTAAQVEVTKVARDSGLDAARALWLTSPLFAASLKIPAAAEAVRSMIGSYQGWYWTTPDKSYGLKPPAITRLAEISAPALIIVGDADTHDFRDIAQILARDIRGAQLSIVKGAGHLPNLEMPTVFNDELLNFLARPAERSTRRAFLALIGAVVAAPVLDAQTPSGDEVTVVEFSDSGKRLRSVSVPKVVKSEAEWRSQLSRIAYEVTRHHGTESAFTGAFWNLHDRGLFRCVCCDTALFTSDHKFDSGTGWPSFWQVIAKENVVRHPSRSRLYIESEVTCVRCDAHLGDLFDDGPRPTGFRYCIDSAALRFVRFA